MTNRDRCAHCKRFFHRNPRVKEQRFCSRRSCQQARKNRWQRDKMARDPDYQANQKDAWRGWQERNRDYWKRYRQEHPDYCTRNRLLQTRRDEKRRQRDLAKEDALKPIHPIETGMYYVLPWHLSHLAKMDALGQKVLIISEGY